MDTFVLFILEGISKVNKYCTECITQSVNIIVYLLCAYCSRCWGFNTEQPRPLWNLEFSEN